MSGMHTQRTILRFIATSMRVLSIVLVLLGTEAALAFECHETSPGGEFFLCTEQNAISAQEVEWSSMDGSGPKGIFSTPVDGLP